MILKDLRYLRKGKECDLNDLLRKGNQRKYVLYQMNGRIQDGVE